jgi:GNAT superfamily N-acetyltransferase
MLLDGELKAKPRKVDIRRVESNLDWASYVALYQLDWRERADRTGFGFDAETAVELAESLRVKSPPGAHWLAFLDGKPRAYASSWEGLNGIGIFEELFTQPEYRKRGLARALVAHAVAEVRKRGAQSVVLRADPTDTPKEMYAAMGFQAIMVTRQYLKHVEA